MHPYSTYTTNPRRRVSLGLSNNQSIALVLVALAYSAVGIDYARRMISASVMCSAKQSQRVLLETEIRRCVASVEGSAGAGGKAFMAKAKFTMKRLLSSSEAEAASERLPGLGDCTSVEEFKEFMKYVPHETCPDDWPTAQKMLLNEACHSFGIPRRNCFTVVPEKFVELPRGREDFRWNIPDDRNIEWNHYDCKSFACLNNRTSGDCRECFQMQNEARRWIFERQGKLDLKSVLALKPGSIRIALDVGGGSGSFAARLVEHNITVLTTGINSGAPFLETMAQRGVLGLHLSHTARLPMFDHTLDMIHTMHSVQYLPPEKLRLMLFDWDRVLRPGGLIWMEFLYMEASVMPKYEATLRQFRYKEHEWYMEKFEENGGTRKMKRLSVVLEKPKHKA